MEQSLEKVSKRRMDRGCAALVSACRGARGLLDGPLLCFDGHEDATQGLVFGLAHRKTHGGVWSTNAECVRSLLGSRWWELPGSLRTPPKKLTDFRCSKLFPPMCRGTTWKKR